ncbi:hypothetical protein RADP37_05533 (plasmid) [Roseomonas mucosa]|uniref:DUF4089 domain-containing protein n=1 Tax=Roseomonas mucosa TaxID=207340 RepID=A0A4Y1MRH2_9PROT|nr:DUF4089 domain-containing protein [Roseomonas mucosa]AWV20582.1 hypothetical protein RADP37_05533 [Roseomonas mucosa]
MPNDIPVPLPVPAAADLDAAIDIALTLQGVTMAPEWRPAVRAGLGAVATAARLVLEFPLEDEAEPAPVFRA